jgi:hypothetical protein
MSANQLIQVEDLVNDFYSKPFSLSYSGLNKMLYSPSLFYRHYILQQREEKLESYLIDGKVIHCLLLDDGSFNEQFMLMPSTLPTDNTRKLVDAIYNTTKEGPGLLENYTVEILEYLKKINLHQSLADDKKAPFKTGDDKRLEKILTEDAKSYFEFLKIKKNKDLLDEVTMTRCNEAVTALRENSKVCDLLGLLTSEMDNVDIHNEKLYFAEVDFPFGLKGVVDNIKVDHDKKIIYVNDLKTTGKTIVDFKETIEFYNYWSQAAIYMRLVWYNFSELLNTEGWSVVFHFVVIDKYQQVYPFEITIETMQDWQARLEEKLKEAAWHYNSRDYSLPKAFAEGSVKL